MKRDLTVITLTIAALALGLVAGRSATARKPRPEALPREARLHDAAPSIDILVQRLLAALAAGDRTALERLRVDQEEYLRVILPGNVEPGTPPQRMPADKARFFWDVMNTKSAYSAQNLLNEFGGHRYQVKDIAYAKGKKQYAWFTAYEQLRLTLEDEGGEQRELRTGSIAEVRGAFKFVSFLRD
jgi:hypothetical protein